MNNKTILFIEKAKKVHKNRYNYSEVKYINSRTKVTIICEKEGHGIFLQTPNMHLRNRGCPKCGIITRAKKNSLNTNSFIVRARNIHGDCYDYSEVKYVNYSKTKITIICPKKNHGKFLQTPSIHLRTHGCQKCATLILNKKLLSNIDEFIIKARNIHGNEFDYTKSVYLNSYTKIIIICKKNHEFLQLPTNHLAGHGCSKCMMCPSCQLLWTRGVLCIYCKPLNKNKLYQKTKEMKVVKFLRTQLPDRDFIHNKSVGRDCTNGHLFPDIRFDCGYYNLIVEVDEHKHRGANYKCDEQRMYDIIAKLGQPCVFIRYNPDNKKSDIDTLLKIVKKYLKLSSNDIVWDNYGFAVEYLFY